MTENEGKHIELMNLTGCTCGLNTVEEICRYMDMQCVDTVAICDAISLDAWDDLRCVSKKYDLRPLYGVTFFVITPEDCAVEYVRVICYAQNQNGIDEIIQMYSKRYDDWGNIIDAATLWKYSQDITVGFNMSLCYDLEPYYSIEKIMLAIDSIFEHFIVPQFVVIDEKVQNMRPWRQAYERIKKEKDVLICAVSSSLIPCKSLDDKMLEMFSFLGEEAEEIVFDNPRKIANMSDYDFEPDYNITIDYDFYELLG